MPRRRRHHKRNVRELEFLESLELWGGPCGESVFASDDERREVYEHHRASVLDQPEHLAGSRHWAWWVYSAPEDAPHPDDFHESEHHHVNAEAHELAGIHYLAEHGLLEAEEVAYILAAPQRLATPYARQKAEERADALRDGLHEITTTDPRRSP